MQRLTFPLFHSLPRAPRALQAFCAQLAARALSFDLRREGFQLLL